MFADPIVVANSSATNLTLPRVDAGPQTGKFRSVAPGTANIELNIRNTSYFSKTDKRTYARHNIELTKTRTVSATSIAPETFKKVKAYLVFEHDDRSTLAEILDVCDQLASFVIEAKNSGFVQKLVNNEA